MSDLLESRAYVSHGIIAPDGTDHRGTNSTDYHYKIANRLGYNDEYSAISAGFVRYRFDKVFGAYLHFRHDDVNAASNALKILNKRKAKFKKLGGSMQIKYSGGNCGQCGSDSSVTLNSAEDAIGHLAKHISHLGGKASIRPGAWGKPKVRKAKPVEPTFTRGEDGFHRLPVGEAVDLVLEGVSVVGAVDHLLNEDDQQLRKYNQHRRVPFGKSIGGHIYVHKDYADRVVPSKDLAQAKKIAGAHAEGHTTVRYTPKTGEVAFQFSPDFDTAHEPTVTKTVTVRGKETKVWQGSQEKPQIWHHKWQWVGDDYKGFDVQASKQRSLSWLPHIQPGESSKIGSKHYWDSIKHRWEGK